MKSYKYLIIGLIILICIVLGIILLNSNDKAVLNLNGDEIVTINQGDNYDELGYIISNNKYDLSEYQVDINNQINTNVLGSYVITYSLYYNNKLLDEKERNVNVIYHENIKLELLGNSYEYVFKNSEYHDKSVLCQYENKDISSYVIVNSNVNTSIPGVYNVIYEIEYDGRKAKIERKVEVIDINIIDNTDLTKQKIALNIICLQNIYVKLPDDTYCYSKNVEYYYQNVGNYTFSIVLDNGNYIDYTVNISSIDNDKPIGTCNALIGNGTTVIKVDANDNSGIKKYVYNNVDYNGNLFTINGEVNNIIVRVYDNFDNYLDINCSVKKSFDNNMNDINLSNNVTACQSDWANYNRELDNLMQLYGYKTREAVAGAAVYLASFKDKVIYSWGGKYLEKGLNPNWGCKTGVSSGDPCSKRVNSNTCLLGLDCTGFTSWCYVQAGFDKSILRTSSQSTGMWGNFNASKHKYSFRNNQDKVNEIKIGDIVHSEGHVGIVVGVSNTELKVLNEREGIRVSFISKTNGKSRNGDKNFDNFVLFDDFFKMYGNS